MTVILLTCAAFGDASLCIFKLGMILLCVPLVFPPVEIPTFPTNIRYRLGDPASLWVCDCLGGATQTYTILIIKVFRALRVL